MKLYNVPNGSRVRIIDENTKVPIASPDTPGGTILKFHHVDGMYSYCTDSRGNPVHPAAWTEVEIVNNV
jgi:hypothetical protein